MPLQKRLSDEQRNEIIKILFDWHNEYKNAIESVDRIESIVYPVQAYNENNIQNAKNFINTEDIQTLGIARSLVAYADLHIMELQLKLSALKAENEKLKSKPLQAEAVGGRSAEES